METLIVERKDGVVTVTMNRPERKNAANGKMLTELRATFEEVEDNPGRPGDGPDGGGGRLLLGSRPLGPQRPRHRPHPLGPGPHAPPRRRRPRPAPRLQADHRQGGRVRGRCRAVAGARLRPDRLQRPGQALHDLRQARPGARQRRVLAAATARRPGPGQGDRALRGHVERRGGRRHRPGEPGAARSTSSTPSWTTGPRPWPPGRLSPCP